jgi:hypothetical protein
MKNLHIKAKSDAPEVVFNSNNGNFLMSGVSLPENVFEVYNPVLDWLREYKNNSTVSTTLNLQFEYLNTASTNIIMRIVEEMDEIKRNNQDITICWFYETGDYDMRELGEEILEESCCTVQFIEKSIA